MSTEYIERGALIAFVREVRKNLPKDSKDFFTRDEMLLNFQQYVELQPSADVEPVVRCRNCEHSAASDDETAELLDTDASHYCNHLDCPVTENGFCSAGKRKERAYDEL